MRYLQAIVDGVMSGALYALIAVAFGLVWATMRTVNLAFLQILAFAGVMGHVLSSRGSVIAISGAVAVATTLTLISHVVAVRPVLARARTAPIIASVGAGLLIQGLLAYFAGSQLRRMPPLFPAGSIQVGDIFVRRAGIAVVAVVFVFLVATMLVFRYTRIGLAFRVASWAPELGSAYGVTVQTVQFGAVAVAGAAIGLAGVLTAIMLGSVSPYVGAEAALKGVIAMLVGGAGNIGGAVVGGILIGVLEAVAQLYLSGSMKTAVSFGLLLLIMMVRPNGLLAQR